MLVQAGLEHKTSAEIADAYEAAFHADEAAVNILPAHVFPRATEHIPEMVALAEALPGPRLRLRDGRRATSTTTSRPFDGYGALSGNSLDDLRAGHRGEVEPDKGDPADFALWKAAGEGRALKWPTAALGRRLPGLAPRVLGDGAALPGRPVRPAHRRHRQRLPPPRGRDRPVGAARRRAAGPASGSTASTCSCPAGRWRSRRATSSASPSSSSAASTHWPSATSS